jgi:hypothetical protein
MAKIHDQLAHFIQQRHIAFLWRKRGGDAPTDPILRTYRFCNLSRSLDTGTKALWLQYRKVPVRHLPFATLVARCINLPDAVAEYLPACVPEYSADLLVQKMNLRLHSGKSIRGNAYMATTHGQSVPWVDFYAHGVFQQAWDNRELLGTPTRTLQEYCSVLTAQHGIGEFIAGQIIADLKYHLPWMMVLPDLDEFCVPGPGSKRGYALLNSQRTWHETVRIVMQWANAILAEMHAPYSVDAQDAQNILCEFDKYIRVSSGGVYRRKL